MLTSLLLFVVGQTTPILVTEPIVLTTPLDIKGQTYRWAGHMDAVYSGDPAVSKPARMFRIAKGGRLYSSTGTGVVDGAGVAEALTTDADTSGVRISGITFRRCALKTDSPWGETLAVSLQGGSRATQTGGRHIIDNCIFEDSGRVELGGYGHFVKNSVFWRSIETAIQQGVWPLPWNKPEVNGASKITLQNLQFIQCAIGRPVDWDGGICYAGRSFGSNNCRWERLSFYSCNGNSVYWDDGQSFMYADRIFALGNKGRLMKIGGGAGNTLLRVTDVSSSLASVWDDRMNARNGVGGLDAFRHGAWHDFAHGADWTHGVLSGPSNPSMYGKLQAELRAVLAPEALNWRKALGRKYTDLFTNEALFATSGKIEYRAKQGTPLPVNGWGGSLATACHPGVTGTINGVSLALPPG